MTDQEKLTVDTELSGLLPDLTDDEYAQLEANCLAEGRIRDPIDTWSDRIVDGRHRYEIARKHGLPFDVRCRVFVDTAEAKQWICRNQLGRRNLTPERAAYFRGQILAATAPKSSGRPTAAESTETTAPGKREVAEDLAGAAHKSASTIRREEKYAKQVDSLIPGLKQLVLGGKIKQHEVAKLAKLDEDKQQQIARQVRVGQVKSVSAALGIKDTSTDCPQGGAHEWDEGACTKCHEPQPASDVKKHLGGIGKSLKKYVAQIDRLLDASPGNDKYADAARKGLGQAINALEKWRSTQQKE